MKRIYITAFFALLTFGQCLNSEKEFRDFFKQNINSLNPIEGIWSISANVLLYRGNSQTPETGELPQYGTIAVLKKDDCYLVCNGDGNTRKVTIKFYKTAKSDIYLFNEYFNDTKQTVKGNAVLSGDVLLEYSYQMPNEVMSLLLGKEVKDVKIICTEKWIKMFPTENDYESSAPSAPASGTGFAISSNGMIVTNHHVVNGATNINVRGINGDFSRTYKAKIVSEDRNNDLAIIQIDDISFSSLGTTPYVLLNKTCDVGTSVFCLGYPFRATMGDEVKLTNGIISAKSGFQGDITTYQITAPVQPGNSGGPLFDDKGNLAGIINAKHLGAENVSYAIKVSYLSNLIEALPTVPKLQTLNTLEGKSLSEQVKSIKNFVYIIEINENQ